MSDSSKKPIKRKTTKRKTTNVIKTKNIQDNKKSFYILLTKSEGMKYNIIGNPETDDDGVIQKNEIDIFTSFMLSIDASDDWYLFSQPSNNPDDNQCLDYLVYFRLKSRNRPSALQNKTKSIGQCRISGCTRDEWQQQLMATRNFKSKYFCERQPDMNDYIARDLESFEDEKYLYPWQNSMMDILFETDKDTIKPGDSRTIYSIVDMQGCKGKSSFVKWLCYKHPLKLGRLSYGTAAQLRSSIINLGTRQAYIVDLPRTRGKRDSLADLLSAIEDLAGGFVSSPFRGASGQLMLEPPLIFVMSNFKLSYGLMTDDRWKIFEISEQAPYTLDEVTEDLLQDSELDE